MSVSMKQTQVTDLHTLDIWLFPDPPQGVTITSSPGPYADGESVTLNCQVGTSNPPPAFKWFRNSIYFASGESHQFNVGGSDHNVAFRCDATNTAGTSTDEITLQVERKITLQDCSDCD